MSKKTNRYQATLREMLALEAPINVRVSPEGNKVAFTVRTTNWKDNRYENYCYIYDDQTSTTHQLTRYGNVQQVQWMDDETAVLLKANGGESQVWLFEGSVGEGWQVTEHKTGVEWFHVFAGGIVFMARQPDKDEKKTRTDQYGRYTHFAQEESASAVYYLGLQERREYLKPLVAATEEEGKRS